MEAGRSTYAAADGLRDHGRGHGFEDQRRRAAPVDERVRVRPERLGTGGVGGSKITAAATPGSELNVLAYSIVDGQVDPMRTDAILHRATPAASAEWLFSLGITRATGPVRLPGRPEITGADLNDGTQRLTLYLGLEAARLAPDPPA